MKKLVGFLAATILISSLFVPFVLAEEKTLIVGVPTLLNSLDFEQPTLTGGQIISLMRDKGLRWKEQPYPFDESLAANNVFYPDFTIQTADAVEGRLIESFHVQDDAKSATFRLRKGVTSQWGNELTTQDVLYTLERAKALNGFQAFLWGTAGITGPENLNIIDEYNYEIHLDSPNGLIALINCHSWTSFIDSTAAKQHATENDPYATEWVSRNNCGFSPYELLEWRAGQYMTWKAREDWWAGKPDIDIIMLREIPESSNRVAMLEAGTIDMALNLDPDELNYLKTVDGVDVWNILTANSTWIFLDCEDEIFDDPVVRQAMIYALPAEEIARDVYKGYGTPMRSQVPAMIPGSSDYWPYEYDLEKAKQLITDAGYPDGFTCEIGYDNSNPMDEAICVAYQASLEKIGITLKLKSTMLATLTEQKYAKELQICMETGLPVQPDINFGCSLYFKPGGSNNFGKYDNPTVAEMLNIGAGILDYGERVAYHEEIQKILVDEVCAVPVVSTNLQIAKRDYVGGRLVYDTVNDFYWDLLDINK
ncbi:MAG: ABC transporter substrate-binding protein [Christensenellales bacterium]|jgi:peptide/nickel transport system substrate-binding protein